MGTEKDKYREHDIGLIGRMKTAVVQSRKKGKMEESRTSDSGERSETMMMIREGGGIGRGITQQNRKSDGVFGISACFNTEEKRERLTETKAKK